MASHTNETAVQNHPQQRSVRISEVVTKRCFTALTLCLTQYALFEVTVSADHLAQSTDVLSTAFPVRPI